MRLLIIAFAIFVNCFYFTSQALTTSQSNNTVDWLVFDRPPESKPRRLGR